MVLAFGRPYKRVGKSTVKMSKDEYERLILEKHKDKLYFDSQICTGAKLKDINNERLLWFVKEARVHRGLDVEEGLSTIEKLKQKHTSIPRNPLIARAFFWVKYVEEVGTGTNKIIKWCEEWKLPEPEFEDTGAGFVITFKRFHVSESLLEKLNERQKKAIDYLIKNKRIANKEYRTINPDVSDRTALTDLVTLTRSNIIIPKGTKKFRYYALR
ncbi:MAG: ATP-binding protein [Elusimicrobiota bacterium]